VIGKHDKQGTRTGADQDHGLRDDRDRDADRRTGAVRVETDAVRDRDVASDVTSDVTSDVGLGAARRRFGGFDLPAALAGMLAALGTTVLLAGIAGAAGSVGYERGANAEELSTGGLITGLVILLAAFFVGGWVAGRMARYDGVLNGMSTAVLFVLLAGGISAAGAWLDDRYDFFEDVNLPQWFSGAGEETAIGSAVLGIVVMLLAAALGGAVGARYHRRADAVIVGTREGDLVAGGAPDTLDRSELIARRAVR